MLVDFWAGRADICFLDDWWKSLNNHDCPLQRFIADGWKSREKLISLSPWFTDDLSFSLSLMRIAARGISLFAEHSLCSITSVSDDMMMKNASSTSMIPIRKKLTIEVRLCLWEISFWTMILCFAVDVWDDDDYIEISA